MVKNWKDNIEFHFKLFTLTQYVVLHQMIELYVKSLENLSQILITSVNPVHNAPVELPPTRSFSLPTPVLYLEAWILQRKEGSNAISQEQASQPPPNSSSSPKCHRSCFSLWLLLVEGTPTHTHTHTPESLNDLLTSSLPNTNASPNLSQILLPSLKNRCG